MRFRRDIAEELEPAAEEFFEKTAEGRARLAERAEALKSQFAENVTQQTVTSFAGWTLVSTGLALGVTGVMRGRTSTRSMIAPVVLLTLGMAVLSGGSMWYRRSAHIGEAEARVREEMYALDPFARFTVLRDVAGETVPFVRKISLRN